MAGIIAGRDDATTAPYAGDTNGTVATADDGVAAFSSYGNGTRNPDLLAPGVHVASLRDPGSYLDTTYGSVADVGDRFFRGSGTSQATAVVSGAAALVLQQHSGYTPDQVKALLTATASSLGQPAVAQGYGALNLNAALTKTMTFVGPVSSTTGPGPSLQPWSPAVGNGTLQG